MSGGTFIARRKRWQAVALAMFLLAILAGLSFDLIHPAEHVRMTNGVRALVRLGLSPRAADAMLTWTGVAVVGAMMIVAIWWSLAKRALLTIDGEGIRYDLWAEEVVPWSQIMSVEYEKGARNGDRLVVRMSDPGRYLAKTGFRSRVNRARPFPLMVASTNQSFDAMVDAVRYHRPALVCDLKR